MSKRASPKGMLSGRGAFSRCFPGDTGKLYAHGTHGGHAACRPRPYLYVYTGLVYTTAIVHGEQRRRELESLPTSILSLPAMAPMEIQFPSLHRNFCFLRNPLLSSHYSWERLKGYGLSCGLRRFSMMIILFLFCLEGVWTIWRIRNNVAMQIINV